MHGKEAVLFCDALKEQPVIPFRDYQPIYAHCDALQPAFSGVFDSLFAGFSTLQ
jgi:hypothetical protein